MYIVIKKELESEEVLNIVFGENDYFVNDWIQNYMMDQIVNLKMCPTPEGLKSIDYIIENNYSLNECKLIKKYKKVNKGYVYNTSEKQTKILFTIKYLQYDGDNIIYSNDINNLHKDLNNEINNRVMRQLDKDSLFQVIGNIQKRTLLKKSWNQVEFTNMVSETVKTFKKELYSSIAKKMKRFGQYRKQEIPKIVISQGLCELEAKSKLE